MAAGRRPPSLLSHYILKPPEKSSVWGRCWGARCPKAVPETRGPGGWQAAEESWVWREKSRSKVPCWRAGTGKGSPERNWREVVQRLRMEFRGLGKGQLHQQNAAPLPHGPPPTFTFSPAFSPIRTSPNRVCHLLRTALQFLTMWGHVPFRSEESTPVSLSLSLSSLCDSLFFQALVPSATGAMLVCLFVDSSEALLRAAIIFSFSLQDFLQFLFS